jgi:hypothetical protein
MDAEEPKAEPGNPGPLEVKWSNHAIERVGQRFGFDSNIRIPNKKLGLVGASKSEGEEFEVHSGMVVYGCIRTEGIVLVRTVLKYKPKQVPNEFESRGDARRRRVWETIKKSKDRYGSDIQEW